MNTASAPSSAVLRSVVKLNRPAAALAETSCSRPGSKIGISPRCKRAIFSASLSTQVTDTPNSEKQAPETSPTYPVPIIATRICRLPSERLATAAQNGPAGGLFPYLSLRCGMMRATGGTSAAPTPLCARPSNRGVILYYVPIGAGHGRGRLYRQPRLQGLGRCRLYPC